MSQRNTADGVWGYGRATAAKSSGTVTVDTGGTVTTMQAPRDLTLAADDPVIFQRVGSKWYVVQRYGTGAAAAQPDNPTPPPPKPSSVSGTRTFTPVETRSRQGSKWRTDNDDVYQGEYGGNGVHVGCAFYGNGPRSLAGSTVTSAKVKLRRRSAGGAASAQDTTFRLVTQKTRPSGAPTLDDTTDGPNLRWGEATTFTIPTAWAQEMVDGTAGGLAIYEADGSPYVILDGRGRYSASFSLTIAYTRSL
jgi:hypothetical protein